MNKKEILKECEELIDKRMKESKEEMPIVPDSIEFEGIIPKNGLKFDEDRVLYYSQQFGWKVSYFDESTKITKPIRLRKMKEGEEKVVGKWYYGTESNNPYFDLRSQYFLWLGNESKHITHNKNVTSSTYDYEYWYELIFE